MKTIHWKRLSDQDARTWLLDNDPEGALLWLNATGDDLRDAVCDDLGDFGEQEQHGDIRVVLSGGQ